MRTSWNLVAMFTVLFALTPGARAQVNVTEPPDFSNSVLSPRTITLGSGVNHVSGRVRTPSDGQDNFEVVVLPGGSLTAVGLTLDRSGGFTGSVTFNLSENRTTSGNFTSSGLPLGPGTYIVQVITDFSVGNDWSMTFNITGTLSPFCGNGSVEAGEQCDDANTVACDGCSSTCTTTLDGCVVGGSCVGGGSAAPGNPCMVCRTAVTRSGYSPATAGTSCNDGLFCTALDSCNGTGSCTGTARDCSDALSCTSDACDEAADACTHPVTSGCLVGGACIAEGAISPTDTCSACLGASSRTGYSPRPAGSTCDDGSFCTVGDVCTGGTGTCSGAARDCDDALSCTTDSCDEAADACQNVLSTGCLIGGSCIDEGQAEPGNDCTACLSATSSSAYSPRAAGSSCDDGGFCTVDDACDGAGVCAGMNRDCDDTDACTTDACDESAGACTNEPIAECSPDAGGADAGEPLDASVDDAGAQDGGPGIDAGATDGGGRADSGPIVPVPPSSGCSCRAGASGAFSPLLGSGLLGLAILRLRRRRRDQARR